MTVHFSINKTQRTGDMNSENMKKTLMILGVTFLVVIGAALLAFGYVAYTGSRLDASSKAYVDEAIQPIVSTWSTEELLKRASTQLRQAGTDEQFELLFKKMSALGKLQSYEGSKGSSNVTITTQNGKVISASYVADATFENGKASIDIQLIQQDGVWKILGFRVNSPLFLK